MSPLRGRYPQRWTRPGLKHGRLRSSISRAGLPSLPFHTREHTFATLLLQSDKHPKVVSEALGHASLSITMDMYSHTMQGIHRAAVERLDQRLGLAPIRREWKQKTTTQLAALKRLPAPSLTT